MTFEADEIGVESSMPRDLYEFILPVVTYRLTSAVKDIVHNGQTYRAGTIQRAEIGITTATNEAALEISMAVSHALPQRFLQGGIPPRRIDVNVYRKQLTSGEAQLQWSGRVLSMRCEGHVAKLLVPSRSSDALQRRIPTITMGRECPHILYSSGCNVSEAAFTVTRSVVVADGVRLIVDSAPNATDDWAKWGRVINPTTGESSTIRSQVGAVIFMQLPLLDLVAGQSVQITAGCSHEIQTCATKFANQANFGGTPHRPSGNPFVPYDNGIMSLKKLFGG